MSQASYLPFFISLSVRISNLLIISLSQSLTSCKVLAKSPAPLPLLQPLLCAGFKGERISQKVCFNPSFLCWAPSSRSSLLRAPVALGAPPSPHTHPNPHSAPCSHLSLSDLISESMLVVSLPEVMTVTSSAHARSLI